MESELTLTSKNTPPVRQKVVHLQILFFWPTHKVKFKIIHLRRSIKDVFARVHRCPLCVARIGVTTLELAYHFFPTPQNVVKFAIIYSQLNNFNLQEWHFLCSSLIHTSFNTENGRVKKQKHQGKSWCFCEKLFKKYSLPYLWRLYWLVFTILINSAFRERCFSCLRLLKTYTLKSILQRRC